MDTQQTFALMDLVLWPGLEDKAQACLDDPDAGRAGTAWRWLALLFAGCCCLL
jgi:hypothetical protein